MNLAELISEVYLITNRPDLVGETSSAIRRVTLKLHQSDYFYKDIFETGIAFDGPAFVQDLNYRSIIPLYRAIKYIRHYDPTQASTDTGGLGQFLSRIDAENVLDQYNCTKTDIYYVAGQQIHIKSITNSQYYLLGCYINPDVGINTYASWIAVDHPFAIINSACADIFKMIGKDEQNALYKQIAMEDTQVIKITNTIPEGY